jgi:hypothetical protein
VVLLPPVPPVPPVLLPPVPVPPVLLPPVPPVLLPPVPVPPLPAAFPEPPVAEPPELACPAAPFGVDRKLASSLPPQAKVTLRTSPDAMSQREGV